jgi:hypothetical protein
MAYEILYARKVDSWDKINEVKFSQDFCNEPIYVRIGHLEVDICDDNAFAARKKDHVKLKTNFFRMII